MNDTTELRRLLRQRYQDMGDTLTRQADDEIERLQSKLDRRTKALERLASGVWDLEAAPEMADIAREALDE